MTRKISHNNLRHTIEKSAGATSPMCARQRIRKRWTPHVFHLLPAIVLTIAPLSGALLAPSLQSSHPASSTTATGLSLTATDATTSPVVIAMTREEGKNEKLRKQLMQQLVETDTTSTAINKSHKNPVLEICEIPCIAHADGPDYDQLAERLQQEHWDYVTVTSPEAARVLASVWPFPNRDSPVVPAVAAVGKATEATLEQAGIPVAFCPSKATAKVLVQELPTLATLTKTTVLYPASVQAATTLQDGLTARGDFEVTRLNAYDTVTATWTEEQRRNAQKTTIVCVASPSSIRGWLSNFLEGQNNSGDDAIETPPRHLLAACIGETSAQACRELGFEESQIFYPDKPGIPGWVDAVQQALDSMTVLQGTN